MRRVVGGVLALVLATSLVTPAVADPTAPRTSTTCASGAPSAPDRVWSIAQDRLMALATPSNTLPFGATGTGTYARTNAFAWTSGFYPASLWLTYEHTHDPAWLALARSFTTRAMSVASWTGSHDLGFMVGLPASLGLRLDPSSTRRAAYREAMTTAARSLSARWNNRVGAIKSGDYNGQWGLIIDSAMNAPLLIEVGQTIGGATGNRLASRGLTHMLTLASDFIRADGSTIHRQTYNQRTGRLMGPVYGQGKSTTSAWSRGQAWAINGFTQAFASTGDQRLLDAARRTADYWLAHVPSGCVPAWDLDINADSAPRDSSAAAIAADGLLQLGLVDPDPARAANYLAAGRATTATLTESAWVPDRARNGVLQRQAYNIPAVAREGTYAWGDAYLLLALSRSG